MLPKLFVSIQLTTKTEPTPNDFLVLDKTRYQRIVVVRALATQLGITLLFLPSYSPNLNLVERLLKVTKRCVPCDRFHPTFRDFPEGCKPGLSLEPWPLATPRRGTTCQHEATPRTTSRTHFL